jgi:ankyrin repeat protein
MRSNDGTSPLHLAIYHEDVDLRFILVKILVEAGSDVNAYDKDGNNTFEMLTESCRNTKNSREKAELKELVSIFVKAGAKIPIPQNCCTMKPP